MADDKRLSIRIERRRYRFWAHADGLVTVKVGKAERSAMAGALGPYGIAALLIRELLAERADG